MYKFKTFLVTLAIFGLSIGATNAQTGTYTGNATVKETQYFNINETVNGVSVDFTSGAGGYYELSITNLQFSGINVPTIVMDNVNMTASGSAYNLSRTGSVQNTIPTLTVPAGIPVVGGMTFNNVPVEVTLMNGQIANSVMTLNMQVKITLPGVLPVTITFLTGFTGTLNAATHPALGGGTGTSGDPYQIKTPAHLKQLADFVNGGNSNNTSGIYYKLMNDIDLSAYGSTYNGGKGWNPIGNQSNPFQGIFDGNNHKITNLYINDATLQRGGLFGFIYQGTVKNTGVENGNIKGDQLIGGIAGGLDYGDITGCYFTGSVSGRLYVGGVVSGTENGNILNCYSTGKVSGIELVGGVTGYVYLNANIKYCYSTSTVRGTTNVGGMAGWVEANCTIKNCIAANDSIIATAAGANINRVCLDDGSNIFQNNYALNTIVIRDGNGIVSITDGLNTNAGMSKSITDLQNRTFYATADKWNTAAWDMTAVWDICSGKGLPWLRWQGINCNSTEVVCEIVGGGSYATLNDALAAVPNNMPTTIKLLTNISNAGITINNKKITFDLNGYVLNLNNTLAASYALYISNNGEINLEGEGSFYITSAGGGVNAWSGGKVTVDSITAGSSSASGIFGIAALNSTVNVTGNINVPARDGGGIDAQSSVVTVGGGVTSTNNGLYAYDSTVTIGGVSVTGRGDGVTASGVSVVTVNGNINTAMWDGIIADNEATVVVNGNINATWNGMMLRNWAQVTVNGTIASGAGYSAILIYNTPAVMRETSSKPGYIEYFLDDNTVARAWVRIGGEITALVENVSKPDLLKAWIENGMLHVSGLTAGKQWSIYNAAGSLIYQGIAGGNAETRSITSLSKGVYIIKSGNKVAKINN